MTAQVPAKPPNNNGVHPTSKPPEDASAVIVFADGTVLYGKGLGAQTVAVGEICFNTSLTGYQEILTDPSYAGEIITFTFPHIGNIGTNNEDIETVTPAARARFYAKILPSRLAGAQKKIMGVSILMTGSKAITSPVFAG